ncbi:hypothetical protein PLESTF_000877200 [Pleodorina starrii]|nr:hypothetical protein PLESTF_000877200 [Pleodorina starrii]
MLRGGRGSNPRSPAQCENASVPFTPTQVGQWRTLLPGQAWRLSTRESQRLTHGHGAGAYARRVPPVARAEPLITPPLDGASGGGGAERGGGEPGTSQEGGAGAPATGAGAYSAVPTQQQYSTARSRSAEPPYRHAGAAAYPGAPQDSGGDGGGFRARSAWIGADRRRRGRRGGAAAAARPPPAALSDERIVPLMRKAERDVLPGDDPNTPWRRLAYQLRLAPSISDLLALYRSYRENDTVWRPHMTALALTRTGALLYPRAVAAAASTAAAGSRTDSAGRFPPPALKRDATSLFESLSRKVNKLSVRQVQGMHLARLLVSMAWLEAAGDKCEALVDALIRELQRQRGGKLAQVALVDPPLFGRLVRALAQLAPRNGELWTDLQRLTMAALQEAPAPAGAGGAAARRLWAGPVGPAPAVAAAAAAPPPPPSRPDASTADLANLAFGFAAAGAATPPLFAVLRAAVLSRELPADADTLARLLCAWGRARIAPGPLMYRVLEAFLPLLDTAPPRPIGRLVWSLAMMGVRDERLLCAAAKAIVDRRLVFSSPQELVNVVWAYSHLGWQVEEGAEPLRPGTRGSVWGRDVEEDEEEEEARGRPRGVMRRPPEQLVVEGGWAAGSRAGSPERRERREQQQQQQEEEEEEEEEWHTQELEASARAHGQTLSGDQAERASSSGRGSGNGVGPGSGEDGVGEGSGRWSAAAAAEAADTPPQPRRGDDASRHADGSPQGSSGAGSSRNGFDAAAAATAAALQHHHQHHPLKPLPLAAPLAAREQARQALLQPPPDYPEHFALYRYLGRSFIHRQMGGHSHGGGGAAAAAAHQAISSSQLAVMAGSFARAGYKSKQLFYTTARIALLRLQYLSPADLTLVLSAHARLRIPHTALFEAAAPIVAARCLEFSPAQLADVLWAVQALMPHEDYVRLANEVRARRGWRPPQPPQRQRRRLESDLYGQDLNSNQEDEEEEDEYEEEEDEEEEEVEEGRRREGGGGPERAGEGPLLPALMRLRVPRELLEDVDWIEAEEEQAEGEEAARQRREAGGGGGAWSGGGGGGSGGPRVMGGPGDAWGAGGYWPSRGGAAPGLGPAPSSKAWSGYVGHESGGPAAEGLYARGWEAAPSVVSRIAS